jgi:hypothetical protein
MIQRMAFCGLFSSALCFFGEWALGWSRSWRSEQSLYPGLPTFLDPCAPLLLLYLHYLLPFFYMFYDRLSGLMHCSGMAIRSHVFSIYCDATEDVSTIII